MQFSNPKILWALFTILIPIIVHLFQFRKFKNVYFSNVDLLKELNIERQKISQLRKLIILSLRILTIAALVIVFANPFIPNNNSSLVANSNLINIYVDNSPSMTGKNGSVTLLDDAKNKAKQIVFFFQDNCLYKIYDNKSPINPPLLNKNDAIIAINNVSTSFKKKTLSSVLSSFNLQSTKSHELKATNYIISDFQKTTADFDSFLAITNQTFLVPLLNTMNDNLNITNVDFDAPVNSVSDLQKANITITNESLIDYEKVSLNLNISDKLLSSSNFDITSKSTQTIPLFFPDNVPGIRHGFAEIDDQPIVFDNKLFFTYKNKEKINILDINNGLTNKYVNTLYSGDSLFSITSINNKSVKYDIISSFDFIIIDNLHSIPSGLTNEIINSLKNGKNCLILIPDNIDIDSYNTFFAQTDFGKIDNIETTEDRNVSFSFSSSFYSDMFAQTPDLIKDNIDLPIIKKYYPTTLNTKTLPLIKLSDVRSSILTMTSFEKGNLFILTTLLDNDYSDFQLNALFVPIMYKIAFSKDEMNNMNYTLPQGIIPLTINNYDINELSLICSEDTSYYDYKFEIIDNIYHVRIGSLIEPPAGNYSVFYKSEVVDGFSINNDREESIMDFYSEDEILNISNSKFDNTISIIKSSGKDFEKNLEAAISNKELWQIFLLLAIGFLIAEMVLLRLWHESM